MSYLNYYCKTKISKLKAYGLFSKAGRNFLGRICVQGRGGKQKRVYRLIDFHRRINMGGMVLKILYDCNRTCNLALILYKNGLISFIPAIKDLTRDSLIYSGKCFSEVNQKQIGWAVPLNQIALFTIISNVEVILYQGAKIARAAGVGCLFIGKEKGKAVLKLNSCWELKVDLNCIGTIGLNGNVNHKNKIIGKAGKNRNLGFRPKVRGVAKNPCDHPHGGGNGKHSQPSLPLNRYGKPAKWVPTKNKEQDKIKKRKFKKI